jgi:hypothetical protein
VHNNETFNRHSCKSVWFLRYLRALSLTVRMLITRDHDFQSLSPRTGAPGLSVSDASRGKSVVLSLPFGFIFWVLGSFFLQSQGLCASTLILIFFHPTLMSGPFQTSLQSFISRGRNSPLHQTRGPHWEVYDSHPPPLFVFSVHSPRGHKRDMGKPITSGPC